MESLQEAYSTLHADSPLSAKLLGKFPKSVFLGVFQFFLHGHFTDRQKINSAKYGGFPPRNSEETKWQLSMISILNCI